MRVKHRLYILMAQNEIRTIAELAEMTGITYRSLVNFATYKQKFMDPEIIAKVCVVFGCRIEELLYIEKGQAS